MCVCTSLPCTNSDLYGPEFMDGWIDNIRVCS